MLEPSPIAAELIPSSFLPALPRSKTSLSPLSSEVLLAHIALLRELYIPPIHGGFRASDGFNTRDTSTDADDGDTERRSRVRQRRFSAGLADTMDGLGLGLDIDIEGELSGSGPSGRPKIDDPILEEEEEDAEDDEVEEEEEAEPSTAHLDPFEREWAEKWLNGVVRRAQGWFEEHEDEEEGEDGWTNKEIEGLLRDATAVLAMMAGTSAAGSLTRHLLFPLHHSLVAGLKALNQNFQLNPSLSPTTTNFLASLSTSPISPVIPFRALSPESRKLQRPGVSPERSRSKGLPPSPTVALQLKKKKRKGAVPILLHDAPMMDHLSVGVQTWGSAILLGREMALNPSHFGLFPEIPSRGVRVLELGAGTGLLAILCRKLLDLRMASPDVVGEKYPGVVVATDFHHDVLANLKVCVDLNLPPHVDQQGEIISGEAGEGVQIAKLDWTTFPAFMERSHHGGSNDDGVEEDNAQVAPLVEEPFDLVLASDCVYDPTHAKMLREVAGWVLRLPDPKTGDQGGTFHILSPIRPTFTPELESIDEHFPTLSSYLPLTERLAATGDVGETYQGEGLGRDKRLKLGVRGEGKKSVRGRKGEGRVDEVAGYWWWEVGWG